MSGHTITLAPGTDSERVIGTGKIGSLRFAREHTALGGFRARVPFDLSLEDRLNDAVHIEDGDEFLFRGYLLDVENTRSYRRGPLRDQQFAVLRGKGVAYDLTRNETSRTPTNILVEDEIANVWGLTGFDATVTSHSANTTTDDEQVQEANTTAEFEAISSNIGDTDPLAAQNTNIELLQSLYFSEGESPDRSNGGRGATNSTESADLSGDDGQIMQSTGDWVEYDFTVDYTIPEEDFEVAVRDDDGTERGLGDECPGVEYTVTLDTGTSQVVDTNQATDIILNWSEVGNGTYGGDGWTSGDIPPGTHTLRIEVTDGKDSVDAYVVDCVAPYDGRFSYNFDNTVDSNDALDGPELFPDSHELILDRAPTTWSVNQATLSTSWDDTGGNQRIQLRLPPDGSWGPSDGTEDNTDTITDHGFGSDAGSAVQGRARFSRYGTQSTTPKNGFNGQKLQSWTLTIDGDDIPVITDKEYEGTHLDILQSLHDEGRMHFDVEHTADSKDAFSYPIGEQTEADPGWTIRGQTKRKTLETGYANEVTGRGARDDDGNRLTQTADDSGEQATFGTHHAEVELPDADTQTEVDRLTRQVLRRRVQKSDATGRIDIVAIGGISPGRAYPIEWADGTTDTIPVELVTYEIRAGELVGTVVFDSDPRELGQRLSATDKEVRTTQLAF